MNKYESVIILNPNVDEAGIKKIIQNISDFINSNGKVTKVEERGKYELAYEIQKFKVAYLVIFYFEAESQFTTEIERHYRINDSIIKFMTVKSI